MAEKTKFNILQMLIDGGLDEDNAKKAKAIIDKDIIPKNYVPSDQYNDKVLELATATNDAKKANDDLIIANGYKQKWEDEIAAHETTKTSYEAEKTIATKRTALRTALKTEGANEKLIELLESKFEIDKIEVDGDKIKGWDELVKPVKEQFAEIFGTVITQGANVATPPKSEGGKSNYISQLEAARKSGNTQDAVRIKTEAAKDGVILI